MKFDPSSRERYVAKMNQVEYVEYQVFAGRESEFNYCCLSCPYFIQRPESPTGYWCKKYGFPDRSYGCCDGWEAKREIEATQTR